MYGSCAGEIDLEASSKSVFGGSGADWANLGTQAQAAHLPITLVLTFELHGRFGGPCMALKMGWSLPQGRLLNSLEIHIIEFFFPQF